MPLYDYFCGECESQFEAHASVKNRNRVRCKKCRKQAELVISCTSKPQFMEYYSENLGCQITGPAQKRRIMKAKGVEEKG